jgi:hypothetical protein
LVMCITLARKLRVVVVGREGVFLCWIRTGLWWGRLDGGTMKYLEY